MEQKPSSRSRRLRRWAINLGFHVLFFVAGHANRTLAGAWMVAKLLPRARPLLCSNCFSDFGLRQDTERYGVVNALPCPNCGARETKKLTQHLVEVLASEFFVRGSILRFEYGSAPRVQCNEAKHGPGDFEGPGWMRRDIELISAQGGLRFFHYGPRMWMLGDIEPLLALQQLDERDAIIARILLEYPDYTLLQGEVIHRLRSNPTSPENPNEYDSAPEHLLGQGRLDAPGFPVLYCSQDIEGCVHECRVTVEDELYLATLVPTRDLKLLDLTALLEEERGVTEFESLDLAVHMLFFATKHSYEISRAIAWAAHSAGYDGILYPSYFTQIRSGRMPFETAYGISIRRFPNAANFARAGLTSNIALFGRPLLDGAARLECINRLVIHKASYDIRFGPLVS